LIRDFWRVTNWHPDARDPSDNGHPLYVWPYQGKGRVDDPDGDYSVLYVGDSPQGAIAETFGRYAEWSATLLATPRKTPKGTVKALIQYRGDPAILDLDDPIELSQLGLRPSGVVSRRRAQTQQWARAIYDKEEHQGISWWSYYDPRWASFGLWDYSGLSVVGTPTPLDMGNPLVQEAADIIKRVIT